MVADRKVTGKAASMPAGILIGACAGLALTIAEAVGFGCLISKEVLQENSIGYCAMIMILTSSFLCAMLASAKIKHRKLYVCVLCSALYYLILLSMNALFFNGQYQGMGVTALLVAAGGGTAALTCLKQPKMKKRKRTYR